MCLSNFYALVLGLYFSFLSLAMLVHPQLFKKIMGEIFGSHTLMAISGLAAMFFGIILIVSHNVWVSGWPVVITIIGWFVFLQGLARLFIPDHFSRWMKDFQSSAGFTLVTWVWLLVGIYLIWMGSAQ